MDSFDDYALRLQTYTLEAWPFRHIKLTPTRVAKYGLICEDGKLRCKSCMELFDIPNEDDFQEAHLQRSLNIVKNLHQTNCPYQGLTSNLLFKITREFMHVNALSYYQQCKATLCPLKINLDVVQRIPEKLRVVFTKEGKVDEMEITAIFGWSKHQSLMECKYCGR